MGQLAAIVAHEINNPLAGILTYARLLRKKVGRSVEQPESREGRSRPNWSLIASEAARCGEIVKGLLQFARQGKRNYQANDLNQLVRESIAADQTQSRSPGVRHSTCLDESRSRFVCDAQEIRQALVAVLINACEAVHANEGLIEVGTQLRAELIPLICGSGTMASGWMTKRRSIFSSRSSRPKSMGRELGLGLAAVSGIINQHSGEIEVQSEAGKGTRYCCGCR